MVSSVDSDSVSECHMSTHSATGSTIKSTDSLLKFKYLWIFVNDMYLSGSLVLVIFDYC